MKIIETHNLQKNVIYTVYAAMKEEKVNGELTEESFDVHVEELEKSIHILLDVHNNSKVKFWLATLLTNLNINVWRKAFGIRKMRKEIKIIEA